jgi:4-hydroxybenzoate polyprenyltransferase
VGLSFYPYSLMNASYVLVGSLIAPAVHYDRMLGMTVVYLLAVGVSAHSLDAMAPNKPWGGFLTRRQLGALAAGALIPALAIGLYYALSVALLLIPLGLGELFFLLAYNLELFNGTFHTDFWFAASWGFLPVLAGYVVQTDSLGLSSLWGGLFGFFTAYIEIKASRPYKALKREGNASPVVARLESILKAVVACVIVTAALLFVLSLQK